MAQSLCCSGYTSNMFTGRIEWKSFFYIVLTCIVLACGSASIIFFAIPPSGTNNVMQLDKDASGVTIPHFYYYITVYTDIFQRYSSQVTSMNSMCQLALYLYLGSLVVVETSGCRRQTTFRTQNVGYRMSRLMSI